MPPHFMSLPSLWGCRPKPHRETHADIQQRAADEWVRSIRFCLIFHRTTFHPHLHRFYSRNCVQSLIFPRPCLSWQSPVIIICLLIPLSPRLKEALTPSWIFQSGLCARLWPLNVHRCLHGANLTAWMRSYMRKKDAKMMSIFWPIICFFLNDR